MRMKSLAALVLAISMFSPTLLLAQNSAQSTGQQRETTVLPPINYTEFTLQNGLRVIFHEDHSTPIVAVNVWYHVGSKNEVPGRTGFAHLFEHMMFQGSLHHNNDYFVPLQEAGGTLNGSTNTDRTNYWEVVPSNFLELALWLESDRMGYLLEALTEEKLANQRDVVKNEKRQNYDNRPYGLVGAKIAETIYPKDHPYHWLTIGSLDDLTAATREDVSDFFRRYYTPNNASLVVAGDFNPKEARAMVEKYFGPLKRGPEVKPLNITQPVIEKETRLTMEDRVSLPRVYTTWFSVPQWAKDDAALDTLGTILTGGKGSRLYRALVYERQIAQDVSAFNNSRELAGQFQITATLKQPGRTAEERAAKLKELEDAINAELEKLKAEPPTAEEMERAYNARESSFIYGLQTVGGFGGKSDQLNMYATFVKNPGYFQKDLDRYRQVTPADVSRVAKTYLNDRRLVLTVMPRPRGATTGQPVPEGPGQAIASPAQQTSGAQTGAAATTPQQGGATPVQPSAATTTPQQGADKPAGAQAQTRTEAAATQPAGATPPATQAQGKGKAPAKDQSELGGLYVQPKPRPDPTFKLPAIQRRKLSNGLEVVLVEQHELPVVSMNLMLKTGAAADPQDKAGLASLTAALVDEGTKTRDALQISNELAAIGARLGTGTDWDLSGINLLTLKRHLTKALDIYADVITNASFPEKELQLQRASRLAQLMQRKDDANAIASVVYASLLYGRNHPYGHPTIGDDTSIKAITNEDVRRFYETYYRPNNAAIIVTGDVTMNEIVPQLEKALANWKQGEVPAVNISTPPMRERAGIYIVDKPGAAQSVINIGQIGQPRTTPDFFPLLVLNTLLGGQFTSRVNMNLREDKGYTYGARTAFDYRRGSGPFMATAGVQTAVTKESVVEFMRELNGVRGSRPIDAKELEFAKQAIIRGFPRGFETPEQISSRLTDVVLYGLPDDYFNNYIARVRAVTLEDVNRAANKYLDPSKMAILVVGDRRVIEPGLRSLTDVSQNIVFLDAEGRAASATTETQSGGGGGGNR
ncbi:MAG TPA: insulinase family protein [Pyrinomonadaceae bacterium]|nr:insulinase family protein [Pyrinomonadaceae bacterium]